MIKLKDVCYKAWGNVVLNNVSFELKKSSGAIFYYDSGSGATTTAKIVCGLVKANTGEVVVNGKPPVPSEINATLFLSNPIFYKNKTAAKNLILAARHINYKIDKNEIYKIIEEFGLNPKQKPKKMSRVQKLLLALARSKVQKKDLLVFDDVFRDFYDAEIEQVMPVFGNFIANKTVLIFDSTKKIRFNNFDYFYLLFGHVYKFLKDAPIWQIYCMQNSKIEKHSGKIVEKNDKCFIIENDKKFSFKNSKKFKNAFERGVEEVLFGLNGKIVDAVFDAADFERIL